MEKGANSLLFILKHPTVQRDIGPRAVAPVARCLFIYSLGEQTYPLFATLWLICVGRGFLHAPQNFDAQSFLHALRKFHVPTSFRLFAPFLTPASSFSTVNLTSSRRLSCRKAPRWGPGSVIRPPTQDFLYILPYFDLDIPTFTINKCIRP